jgi:hypothetical protein
MPAEKARSMSYKPEFDADKFRELVLYIARRSADDPRFGMTKLARILCYSDFLTYAYLGRAIAGATYLKFARGPVPRELDAALDDLEQHDDVRVFEAPYLAHPQKRLLALREAKRSPFTEAELAFVDQVIEDLRRENAASDGECSYRELIGWQIAGEHEEIPYETILLSDELPSDDDVRWAQSVAGDLGLLSSA